MNKKYVTIIAVFLLVAFVLFAAIKTKTVKDGMIFTNDIKNYNTDEYAVPVSFFPDVLPASTKVISYCHYEYWDEAIDIYLELRFDTVEELEKHLNSMKQKYTSNWDNKPTKKTIGVTETPNIYDNSYEDVFFNRYHTIQGENYYTGYSIDSNKNFYDCNFGVISYSFDELIVIHAYTNGGFRNTYNHIPMYFERFDIPLYNNHQRVFYLKD